LAGEWDRTKEKKARELARTNRFLPLSSLTESFLRLPPEDVETAYLESYLVAAHILDTYTERHVRRLLDQIADGSSPDAAVRSTLRTTCEELLQTAADGRQ